MSVMDKETFDRQASVVASAWDVLEDNPDWRAILDHFNLGFPFAHLHNTGMGTLKAQGKKQVTDTYDFLLKALAVEDSDDYYSFWDIMAVYNKGA